jgi:hypothetical protein
MKKLLVTSLMIFGLIKLSAGQTPSPISVIDFVKIKDEKIKEALYFYENNWRVYRAIALTKEYIKSYQLLTTAADSNANFDIILITEYSDSTQLKLSEKRFQEIIKDLRPTGPKLLNNVKPNDFRVNLFYKTAQEVFSSEKIVK